MIQIDIANIIGKTRSKPAIASGTSKTRFVELQSIVITALDVSLAFIGGFDSTQTVHGRRHNRGMDASKGSVQPAASLPNKQQLQNLQPVLVPFHALSQ